MSTTEREQQILHDIECGLRHEDRFITARFALLPVRAAMHRRTGKALLVIETVLLILAVSGAVAGSLALFLTAIGLAVAEPLIAIASRNVGRKHNGNRSMKEA